MSSIWSTSTGQAGASPFRTTGMAPSAGDGASAKYQSLLKSSGGASGAAAAMSKPAAAGNQARAAGTAAAASSSTTTTDTGSSATISANDFLTLLVTEMQNQDPTSQQDPNEYINQLVSINSLEQLISINQNLTPASTTASVGKVGDSGDASSGITTGGADSTSGSAQSASKSSGAISAAANRGSTGARSPSAASANVASMNSRFSNGGGAAGVPGENSRTVQSGNLTLPREAAAAHTVAHSLDGHATGAKSSHGLRDFPTH